MPEVVAPAQNVIAENQAYGAQYGVRFRLEESLGEAYAVIDEHRMMQVLANLLSNAAKFFSPDSDVVLHLSRMSGRLRVTVIDTGSGIANDKLLHVFVRFFQVDVSGSRSKQGSGLGLAIVKTIVENHGSQIKVDSEIGKGSTFYFDLEETPAPSHTGNDTALILEAEVA